MGTKTPKRAGQSPTTNLAEALFTSSQRSVLAVLFGNARRSFYANEVIRLAGVGTGAAQRELASLAKAGLLTVTKVGNQKHFQANEASPIFESLRDIVLKTSGLADVLRTALAPFGTQVSAAFVYGSIAKHEDRLGSDIDLMVISDTLAYAELFAGLEKAATRLGRAVNPTLYTRRELDKRVSAKHAFIVRVLGQPKIWIIGNEQDLAS